MVKRKLGKRSPKGKLVFYHLADASLETLKELVEEPDCRKQTLRNVPFLAASITGNLEAAFYEQEITENTMVLRKEEMEKYIAKFLMVCDCNCKKRW